MRIAALSLALGLAVAAAVGEPAQSARWTPSGARRPPRRRPWQASVEPGGAPAVRRAGCSAGSWISPECERSNRRPSGRPSTSHRVLSDPSPSVPSWPWRTHDRTARPPAPSYHCNECGWETGKWVGRCGECQAWGTVVEKSAPKSRVQAGPVTAPARPIGEVPIEDSRRAHQRGPRARPGARRRPGPRSGDPDRR